MDAHAALAHAHCRRTEHRPSSCQDVGPFSSFLNLLDADTAPSPTLTSAPHPRPDAAADAASRSLKALRRQSAPAAGAGFVHAIARPSLDRAAAPRDEPDPVHAYALAHALSAKPSRSALLPRTDRQSETKGKLGQSRSWVRPPSRNRRRSVTAWDIEVEPCARLPRLHSPLLAPRTSMSALPDLSAIAGKRRAVRPRALDLEKAQARAPCSPSSRHSDLGSPTLSSSFSPTSTEFSYTPTPTAGSFYLGPPCGKPDDDLATPTVLPSFPHVSSPAASGLAVSGAGSESYASIDRAAKFTASTALTVSNVTCFTGCEEDLTSTSADFSNVSIPFSNLHLTSSSPHLDLDPSVVGQKGEEGHEENDLLFRLRTYLGLGIAAEPADGDDRLAESEDGRMSPAWPDTPIDRSPIKSFRGVHCILQRRSGTDAQWSAVPLPPSPSITGSVSSDGLKRQASAGTDGSGVFSSSSRDVQQAGSSDDKDRLHAYTPPTAHTDSPLTGTPSTPSAYDPHIPASPALNLPISPGVPFLLTPHSDSRSGERPLPLQPSSSFSFQDASQLPSPCGTIRATPVETGEEERQPLASPSTPRLQSPVSIKVPTRRGSLARASSVSSPSLRSDPSPGKARSASASARSAAPSKTSINTRESRSLSVASSTTSSIGATGANGQLSHLQPQQTQTYVDALAGAWSHSPCPSSAQFSELMDDPVSQGRTRSTSSSSSASAGRRRHQVTNSISSAFVFAPTPEPVLPLPTAEKRPRPESRAEWRAEERWGGMGRSKEKDWKSLVGLFRLGRKGKDKDKNKGKGGGWRFDHDTVVDGDAELAPYSSSTFSTPQLFSTPLSRSTTVDGGSLVGADSSGSSLLRVSSSGTPFTALATPSAAPFSSVSAAALYKRRARSGPALSNVFARDGRPSTSPGTSAESIVIRDDGLRTPSRASLCHSGPSSRCNDVSPPRLPSQPSFEPKTLKASANVPSSASSSAIPSTGACARASGDGLAGRFDNHQRRCASAASMRDHYSHHRPASAQEQRRNLSSSVPSSGGRSSSQRAGKAQEDGRPSTSPTSSPNSKGKKGQPSAKRTSPPPSSWRATAATGWPTSLQDAYERLRFRSFDADSEKDWLRPIGHELKSRKVGRDGVSRARGELESGAEAVRGGGPVARSIGPLDVDVPSSTLSLELDRSPCLASFASSCSQAGLTAASASILRMYDHPFVFTDGRFSASAAPSSSTPPSPSPSPSFLRKQAGGQVPL